MAVAQSLFTSDPQADGREGEGEREGDGERKGDRQTDRMEWAFELSKSTHSDVIPPLRSYPLILPKQFYQLETEHSNV